MKWRTTTKWRSQMKWRTTIKWQPTLLKPPSGSPKQVPLQGVFESKVSKMSYSESEPNFSNFAINSLSTFPPIFSEFESESDESEYICVFLPYICILLNKLADDSF